MYYPNSENKGADQLRSYREADLRLCFGICRTLVFSWRGSYILSPVIDGCFLQSAERDKMAIEIFSWQNLSKECAKHGEHAAKAAAQGISSFWNKHFTPLAVLCVPIGRFTQVEEGGFSVDLCLEKMQTVQSLIRVVRCWLALFEPCREKTSLLSFLPDLTQTRLYNYWRWIEAWNFVGFRKWRDSTIHVLKIKALISVFVFAYAKSWFSHDTAHL